MRGLARQSAETVAGRYLGYLEVGSHIKAIATAPVPKTSFVGRRVAAGVVKECESTGTVSC